MPVRPSGRRCMVRWLPERPEAQTQAGREGR
jgi:hypothetical protein